MSDRSLQDSSLLKDAQEAQATAERLADDLKSSERRFRRLFESAHDGILILDSERGKITDANPFMSELLGYSNEELIGKELWQIGLLTDKQASQDAFQKLKQEGQIRYENIPLENRRHEQREVEFVSNIYREDGHTVIQCNIRDITERKRVEAALAAAAAKNERIAETLQHFMLQKPPAGKFPDVAVETLYEAALDEAAVGGDFFDVFALNNSKIAFVVGDVSGKGLVAAVRTAEVKHSLRTLLHEHQIPEVALAKLNNFIFETHMLDATSTELFIVLAIVVVDTITGDAAFVAAGAEPSVILRVDGNVEIVEASGIALGVVLDSTYVATTEMLVLGDTIIMATDGITEVRRGHKFLGVGGLADLARKAWPAPTLQELSRVIYSGVREYANGILHDDICLLLARRQ